MEQMSPALVDAIVEVAREHLGPEHDSVRAIESAKRSDSADAGDQVMAALRRLPAAHRDHILLGAKQRLRDDADVLNWLARRAGLPDDTPPDATRH